MRNNKSHRSDIPAAHGVDALVARLRDEGVASGRAQGEQIVKDAQLRAELIIEQAHEKASEVLTKARQEADSLEKAGHQALEVAARDAMLSLKMELSQRFAGEVRRLVGVEAQKPELLQRLILEIAGRAQDEIDDAQSVEILLPRNVAGFEELSRNPEELEQGILTHFIRLISQEALQEGITFGVANDNHGGLRIRLVDQEVVLDVSDRAIADVLLQYLQPRFRALLEGIVK
ncbi:hypothetical protein SPB21_13845 [Leptothoe sp. ISB3NOV94-8A]|uniref:hypothetical protein n=1 Tax=Adonisia turfae TaxID=2950184 RepID=UPI0013D8116C|nr:hypothetical protein [Leptothoe sp. LEGE 181152]